MAIILGTLWTRRVCTASTSTTTIFKPFDRVGATGMNGTTNQDRANYFQVVPTTALDMALWIGSMDDLNAASLDDVRTWFKTWYGAANAVLVVAGDVDPEDVGARVERLDHLTLASDVLATGRSSRLYRRLVYEDQIATDVSAFALGRQFGSLFILQATAQPGQDLAAVEAVLDEELRALLESGPTEADLARAQTSQRAF